MTKKVIKEKRVDTRIKTVEKEYRVDFGVRSDMKLGSYLKSKGFSSLAKALDRAEKSTYKK